MRNFLEKDGRKLRLLIGKDPLLMLRCNADPKTFSQKDYIKTKLNEIEVKDEYKEAVKLLLDYCENDKFQIRIYSKDENDESQFFHAKCYILYGNGKGYGIIGSSNWTENGLCKNSELNYLETQPLIVRGEITDDPTVKTHLSWFQEKWNEASDWTHEFLEEVKKSPIGGAVKADGTATNGGGHFGQSAGGELSAQCPTVLKPYECYIKMLQEQFSEIIDGDGNVKIGDYMPQDANFKKLKYQEEAVNQAFAIMRRHNGFILSDVVGLGKTYTALMIAKKHLIETGFLHKVLVISPKAIIQNWKDSIKYFDDYEKNDHRHLKPSITLSPIGTLDEFEENIPASELYSMIIIDESHHFRNDKTKMYEKLDNLIAGLSEKLGRQPFMALLSATPQNNVPDDLCNQIKLFERSPKYSTLSNLGKFGSNLESYFSDKQKIYEPLQKLTKVVDGEKEMKTHEEIENDRQELKKISEDIRKCIVEPLVIRRTRTDIQKYYKDDMETQNLSFPKIEPPIALQYVMDGELGELFDETIDIIAPSLKRKYEEPTDDALNYYRYRALEYLTDELKIRYEDRNITVKGTSDRLAGIMETMLVKRLESSQVAFKESLENMKRYTQNMIDMWNKNRIFICPDLDMKRELSKKAIEKAGSFDACLDVIAKKAKDRNEKNGGDDESNNEYTQSDFVPNEKGEKYIDLLEKDLKIIDALLEKWKKQDYDPKLMTFIQELNNKFLNPNDNKTHKLVIFTECIATQKLLTKNLLQLNDKVLSVTAENRDELKNVIMENFDANWMGEKKNDYDILVTTDILSEGVNLHKANTILNYDSPWNATRLMQRLGRINRIGSVTDKIFNYNFYPSRQGENELGLKNRTYIKLQAFHELFGEDSQIYSTEEKLRQFDKRPTFEEPESPLMPFIKELKDFKRTNFKDYEKLLNIQKAIGVVGVAESEIASLARTTATLVVENAVASMSDNALYKKGEKCEKVSQLDAFVFLSKYKNATSKNVATDDAVLLYNGIKEKFIAQYKTDEANKKVSTKKSEKSNAEKQNAIKKLKSVFGKAGKDAQEKINFICDDIRNGNKKLTKKVLSAKFNDDAGLPLDTTDAVVNELYKWTSALRTDIEADVKTIFYVKLYTD